MISSKSHKTLSFSRYLVPATIFFTGTGETFTGKKSGGSEYVNAIVQELCESRGGRPGLSVLTSLLVSVDLKLY